MIPISSEGKYPKKVFGEIHLKGGLNNFKQILKTKYLLPTKDYPTGKAVIEILIPESSHSFSVDKDELKYIMEINDKLASILEKEPEGDNKKTLAQQMYFNSKLIKTANETKNKPFAVKSFRFNEADFPQTHALMSHLAKLFGYLFHKYKTEMEQESSDEHLIRARNIVSSTMSGNVQNEFITGFNESVNEKLEMKLIRSKE